MMSSGVSNLFKLVSGWVLAAGLATVSLVYFDEIRSTLGLKLEPADFGITAEAVKPSEPEPRVIIRYVERPAEPKPELEPVRRPRRQSFSQSVELQRQSDGHFHAEAFINGRPVRVLVDTGATLVALSYEDAVAAGINVRDSDFIHISQTANGRARFASVILDDVRIGDVTVRNVRAAVGEPGRLSTTLLGMSFLGQTRMQMQGATLLLEQ